MENIDNKHLEKKPWYRLLKVIYGIGWFGVFALSLIAFLSFKPTGYLNLTKSFVTCPNNKSYQLSNLIKWYKTAGILSEDDAYKIMKACGEEKNFDDDMKSRIEQAKTLNYSEDQILSRASVAQAKKDLGTYPLDQMEKDTSKYKFNLIQNGNWGSTIAWTVGTFLISAFLLDLIKNITLYILLGKKFSYKWLFS